MSREVTTGYGGHVQVPDLAARELIDALLSARARKAWGRAEALAHQHADLYAERARIEGVQIPEAEAAQHERAVAAVRAGEPVEHAPTVSALKERAARLDVEATAVVTVLAEALSELRQTLLGDQARMTRTAFDALNAALTDEAASPEGRLEKGQALAWAVWVGEGPEWPTSDLPEMAQIAAARATLAGAPTAAARRVAERAVEAGLLGARPEAEGEVA